MAAPLRRKNTLEQTGFALTDEGFQYRGQSYAFGDIIETLRLRQRLETHYLFIGSDYTHAISVVLVMRAGDREQLTETPTFFGRSRSENVDKIEEIFAHASIRTFQQRAKKYLDQLHDQGHFEYSGWQFWPASRTVGEIGSEERYSTEGDEFLRSFGFLEVRRRSSGPLGALSAAIRRRTGIGTLRDTDVFYALLAQYFGLRWDDA